MKKYILIKENTFEKVRKKINENKDKKIIFTSDNDELNRKVLEKLAIDVLLINQSGRRDFQKQRNSGFNQVLAKIAKKGEVAVGINLDEIIVPREKSKLDILARVQQNTKLCNKNKLRMVFCGKNDRSMHDLKALGLVLGMPTWMTKDLQTFFN
ncbi:hypothetical protein CMI44_00900 [Candidatus Pacearchaeota archaeon]|nr:hypothetical protein [Candidatus Pacearchaeota archaeon]|tara:strand:- start:1090 stop:1551 length:462 start_codon:yes stop_codon:yes gene_type:complete